MGDVLEHTLYLPKPKFKVGDIIDCRNTRNNESIFVRIEHVRFTGVWHVVNENADVFLDDGDYNTTVQPGSRHDNPEKSLMRPGICLIWSRVPVEKFKKVDWTEPITTMDTHENVIERQKKWKELRA